LDNEIDRVRAEMQAASLEVDAGDTSFDADAERQRDELKIKRIEGIKELVTLNEAEYRELVDLVGNRVFKAGMGAEAVWELLNKLDMDRIVNGYSDSDGRYHPGLRDETRSSSGQRRKKATKRLRVFEAFRKSGNKPQWMVMK